MIWLQQTLKESDATFKLIITPVPLIGFNAVADGFAQERQAFFSCLRTNHIRANDLYIICGGSSWPYHIKNADGYEEFASGVLHVQNAFGAKKTNGGEKVFFAAERPVGSFLLVEQRSSDGRAMLAFTFKNESGTSQYLSSKQAHTRAR